MPATITLEGDVDEALSAFDAFIAKMDAAEAQADALGVSVADLNKELDARKQAAYAAAVKRAADELDGYRETLRDAAIEAKHLEEQQRLANEQAEKVRDHNERMERFKSGVTAVSAGFLALKEAIQVVDEAARATYETVAKIAETGDAAAVELKEQMERAAENAELAKQRWISADGEMTKTGQVVESLTVAYQAFALALGGVGEAQAVRIVEGQKLKAVEKSINDELAKRDRAQEIKDVQELAKAEEQLALAKKRLDDAERFNRDVGGGTVDADELASLKADHLDWDARVRELRQKQQEDEKRAAEERAEWEKKEAEERARLDEETYKKREELAERAADWQRKLTALQRAENEATFAAERGARQEEAEHWLKLKGQEDQVHESRLRFAREEAKKAVELAEFEAQVAKTDEERHEAEQQRIKAKHALERAEAAITHAQKMKLVEKELAEQKKQDEELRSMGDPVSARLGRGERFSDILADRQKRAREQFLKENEDRIKALNDPASGLSDRDRQREQTSLERGLAERLRSTRMQTVGDAEVAAGRRDRRRADQLPDGGGEALQTEAQRQEEIERRRVSLNDRLAALVERQAAASKAGADAMEFRIENLERRIQAYYEAETARIQRARTIRRGYAG